MWAEKTFTLGERRSVTLNVGVGNNATVQPENPVWELVRLDTDKVEASGLCQITRDEDGVYQLSALIEPEAAVLYRLNVSFGIGGEIRKPYMLVKVI